MKNEYPKATISFLYLTPGIKLKNFNEAFNKLPSDITKKHMDWANDGFSDILRQILRKDDEARITPLSQELRFVLKSFILFAENGFQPKIDEPSNVTASKYFKAVVAGLSGLQQLQENTDPIYIGFIGGTNALEKALIKDLENKNYKWDNNKLIGKTPSNWIRLSEFKEILEKKGWKFESPDEILS